MFAGGGIQYEWTARPGPSQSPVTGFSYAVGDTTSWPPYSDTRSLLWFPAPGPQSFFLRAIDLDGFITTLVAKLRVFSGPRFCNDNERTILVVLDTSSSARGFRRGAGPVIDPVSGCSELDSVLVRSGAGVLRWIGEDAITLRFRPVRPTAAGRLASSAPSIRPQTERSRPRAPRGLGLRPARPTRGLSLLDLAPSPREASGPNARTHRRSRG